MARKKPIEDKPVITGQADRDKLYTKLDTYQKEYYQAIMDKSVIFVNAKAGTGKTTIAVMAGLELLSQGRVSKLMYVRFPDERSLKLGFLPGLQEDKERVLMFPFYDACIECGLQPELIDKLKQTNVIETTTDLCMRGRNLKDTFLVIDEAQNGGFTDMKLILTRLHDDSKCVVIGHTGQRDNNYLYGGRTAFELYIEHMTKKSFAIECELPNNYRGKISKHADELEV